MGMEAEIPAITKAIDGLYVMNGNDRLKELARMREKAMHDRASELEEAILTGEERGIAKGMEKGLKKGIEKGIEKGMEKLIYGMRAAGFTEEQIAAAVKATKNGI